jgi:hypothetical protein
LSQISPVVKPVGYAAYQRRVAREERKQTRDAKVAIDSAPAPRPRSAARRPGTTPARSALVTTPNHDHLKTSRKTKILR